MPANLPINGRISLTRDEHRKGGLRRTRTKRLKELEVKQESHFSWYPIAGDRVALWTIEEFHHTTGYARGDRTSYAAFTVAELGALLGKAPRDEFVEAYLDVMSLLHEQLDMSQMAHNLITQPDIPAQMLIYLLENKLVTV